MAERFIGGLRLYRRGRTKPPRVVAFWALHASRPLAELLVDDQRVLLQARWGLLRWGFRLISRVFSSLGVDSTWEAPRGSVSAETFGRTEITRGVVLRATGLPPAIFWCSAQTQRAVLATLQAPAS